MKTNNVSCPNLNLKVLAEAIKQDPESLLDLQNQENQQLGKYSLRDYFEELFQKQLPMARSEKPSSTLYNDLKTEATYRAFIIAVTESRKAISRSFGKMKKQNPIGPFIIGTKVSDGTFQFGYRPFIHGKEHKAKSEAENLHEKHGKAYTIFAAVDQVGNEKPTEVKESKQGTKGKLVRSPFKVMEDLATIFKDSTHRDHLLPTGINITDAGNYRVDFVLHGQVGSSSTFTDYSEAISEIETWMKEYKKKMVVLADSLK